MKKLIFSFVCFSLLTSVPLISANANQQDIKRQGNRTGNIKERKDVKNIKKKEDVKAIKERNK